MTAAPENAVEATCYGCGTAILWVRVSGVARLQVIEAEPERTEGTIVQHTDGTWHVRLDPVEGEVVYRNHRRSCVGVGPIPPAALRLR